jgi:hypothetical protein
LFGNMAREQQPVQRSLVSPQHSMCTTKSTRGLIRLGCAGAVVIDRRRQFKQLIVGAAPGHLLRHWLEALSASSAVNEIRTM